MVSNLEKMFENLKLDMERQFKSGVEQGIE